MINPRPCWPEYGRQKRFRETWRHVDYEISYSVFCDRLKVVADRVYMDPVDEGCVRFQYRPALHYEFMQPSPGFLRFQSLQLSPWRAQEGFQGVRSRCL